MKIIYSTIDSVVYYCFTFYCGERLERRRLKHKKHGQITNKLNFTKSPPLTSGNGFGSGPGLLGSAWRKQ